MKRPSARNEQTTDAGDSRRLRVILGFTGLATTLLLFPLVSETCSAGLLPHRLLGGLLIFTAAGHAAFLVPRLRWLGLCGLSAGHLLSGLCDLSALQPPVLATLALLWAHALYGWRGVLTALGTLYALAGLGKLGEGGTTGAQFLSGAFAGASGGLQGLAYLALLPGPLIELALAAALLLGRARVGALLMGALHLSLLALLIRLDWGALVWPWNVQLALVAGLLWARGDAAPPWRSAWPPGAVMLGAAALSMLGVFPSGAQFNLYGRTHPAVEVQTTPGAAWTTMEAAFQRRTGFGADTSHATLKAQERCAARAGWSSRRRAGGRLLPWLWPRGS